MKEWFDSEALDVSIRVMCFARADRRLCQHLITHSLKLLFSKCNSVKLHFTCYSFILLVSKPNFGDCQQCLTHLQGLCSCAGLCGVLAPTLIIIEKIYTQLLYLLSREKENANCFLFAYLKKQ